MSANDSLPGCSAVGKLTNWYVEKKRLVSAEAGQVHVGDDARACVESAREALQGCDARALEAHTLEVSDGQ